MTVTTIHPDILRAAQSAWIDLEHAARETFAHARLDNLGIIRASLTPADRFDAVYAIWDDFIDGRRADDLFEPPTTADLMVQAAVFARVSMELPAHEVVDLAQAAWGTTTFEVFLINMDGHRIGKLGWYGGGTFAVRFLGAPGTSRTISHDRGRTVDDWRECHSTTVALHPVFGRDDS